MSLTKTDFLEIVKGYVRGDKDSARALADVFEEAGDTDGARLVRPPEDRPPEPYWELTFNERRVYTTIYTVPLSKAANADEALAVCWNGEAEELSDELYDMTDDVMHVRLVDPTKNQEEP